MTMMMLKPETCLNRSELRDYLDGRSDPAAADVIESHLARCRECEETLEQLEQEEDTVVRHLRAGHDRLSDQASGIDSVLEHSLRSARALMGDSHSHSAPQVLPMLHPPETIGAYHLLRPLGSGGMGMVFLAKHRELGKLVAIKLLPRGRRDESQRTERFLREIRAAGSLHHPAIVNATDAGRQDDIHFLVMEFIDGMDVSQIARTSPISIPDACEIVRQAAAGLEHAHREGIVHRDIKPSNLMIRRDGEVKILDFGLARVSAWDGELAELTTVGQLMGTLDYMAPEQADQPALVDYRADLYALGATLFRLLAGRPPLAAAPDLSPLAKLRLLANHHPPRLDSLRKDLPAELVELTARLLSADPNDRPASASHVAEDLDTFATGSDLSVLVQSAAQQPTETDVDPGTDWHGAAFPFGSVNHPPRRRRWLATAALPILLLISLAAVVILLQRNKGQLIIESDVADVSVELVADGETAEEIRVDTGVNSTRIHAGTYKIRLGAGSDRISIDRGTIKIERGETTIARIRQNSNRDLQSVPAPPTTSAPVYEGRTLNEWLDVVATEREPGRIEQALGAVVTLATPRDRDAVLEAIIPNSGRFGGVNILGPLMKRLVPEDEFADFVVSQLASDNTVWISRMIDMTSSIEDATETRERVAEWILQNVLVQDATMDRAKSVGLLVDVASDPRHSTEFRNRIQDRLRQATFADPPMIPAFDWFREWNHRVSPWKRQLLYDLCRQKIVAQATSDSELSASLAVLRMQRERGVESTWQVAQDAGLAAAIRRRLVATDRDRWSNQPPDDPDKLLPRSGVDYLDASPQANFENSIRFAHKKVLVYSDPIIELLLFANAYSLDDSLGADLTEPLQQLVAETRMGYERVKKLIEITDLPRVTVQWESMTAVDIFSRRSPPSVYELSPSDLPSREDWFDVLVHHRAMKLLERTEKRLSEQKEKSR